MSKISDAHTQGEEDAENSVYPEPNQFDTTEEQKTYTNAYNATLERLSQQGVDVDNPEPEED